MSEMRELPCDVKLPPATTIMAGCKLETLIEALCARGMSRTLSISLDQEGLVEKVAEALWRAEWAEGHEPACTWDAMCSEDWDIAEAFRAQARAAILAIRQEVEEVPYCGIVVVPEGD